MEESLVLARGRLERFQQEELSALQKELLKDEIGDPDQVLRKNSLQPSAWTTCQTLVSRKAMRPSRLPMLLQISAKLRNQN